MQNFEVRLKTYRRFLILTILRERGDLHYVSFQFLRGEKIPSKLEVAPYALKMSEWVSGVEWMDTP